MSARSYILDLLRSPSTRQWWPWVLASPLVIVACEYLAVAPFGHHIFLWFEMPFVLGLPCAALALVALPFVAISRNRRQAALAWWLASLCFLPLSFCGLKLGKKIRTLGFEGLAARSAPLVEAIHQYTDDSGSPPESLDDLVPDYLEKVPRTGVMAYPRYYYDVASSNGLYGGNPWVLRIPTPTCGIGFDRFVYFPLQNYPDCRNNPSEYRRYGGWFERIGDWAYFHE